MSVPFFRPPRELEAALAPLTRAYLAGHASFGPEVPEFEAALAERLGLEAELVVGTASGTDALTLALLAAGSERVAVPALTWNATANAVRNAGAEVVLVDVDERGLMAADGDGDTALPVHLYGAEAALRPGRTNVVDGAQALELGHDPGAAATCFSFHALKSLPLGFGGAAAFADRGHADAARAMRQHGIVSRDGAREQTHERGFRAFLTAPVAALGTALLPHVDAWWARRREVVATYADAFDPGWYVPRSGRDACHAFVLLPPDRAAFQQHCADRGVATAVYYVSLADQGAWRPAAPDPCPVAERLGSRACAIPLFPAMSDAEVDAVIAAVRTFDGW